MGLHTITVCKPLRLWRRHSLAALSAVLLLISGCTPTVNWKHPIVDKTAPVDSVAMVYFLRPLMLKPKGIADNALTISYQGEAMLRIAQGEYRLMKIKPSQGDIATHSMTKFINKDVPIEVSRKRTYKFLAGKTYFIHIKQVNEEFRGVFYDPQPLNFQQAKQMAENMSAKDLADDYPLDKLQAVAEGPDPSVLEPAFPENLYPGRKYLIKGNPNYLAPGAPKPGDEEKTESPPVIQQNQDNELHF